MHYDVLYNNKGVSAVNKHEGKCSVYVIARNTFVKITKPVHFPSRESILLSYN